MGNLKNFISELNRAMEIAKSLGADKNNVVISTMFDSLTVTLNEEGKPIFEVTIDIDIPTALACCSAVRDTVSGKYIFTSSEDASISIKVKDTYGHNIKIDLPDFSKTDSE